jgi:glycosyltransferase involved in cell wall biosynthesis
MTRKITTVVHIITGLGMGGAERMLSNVVMNMDEDHFCNIVVSLKDLGHWGPILQENGITVYHLDMQPSFFSLIKIFKLRKILLEHKPDCLQGWMYHANIVATLVSKITKVKKVFWNIRCSLIDFSKYRFTTKLVFKLGALLSQQPTAILNNSKASIRQHELHGYSNTNTILVPNGFDIHKFKPDPEIYRNFRVMQQLPTDAILIGIVARFDPMKDHATFIHAATIMAQLNPKVYFICAGTGMNSKNTTIYNLIMANALQERVFLLDQVNEVQYLLPALDYLTQTSTFGEGFPNVVAEAMSCGVECFVTNVGESLEIVGNFGFEIPKQDPYAIAQAWKTAIARDADDINAARHAARLHIIANYSIEKVANIYSEIYSRGF